MTNNLREDITKHFFEQMTVLNLKKDFDLDNGVNPINVLINYTKNVMLLDMQIQEDTGISPIEELYQVHQIIN